MILLCLKEKCLIMETIVKNKELLMFLEKKFLGNKKIFNIVGANITYDLFLKNKIENIKTLKVNGVYDLSGIECLTDLVNLTVNGVSNYEGIDKLSNLKQLKLLADIGRLDISQLLSLDELNLDSFIISGKSIKQIKSDDVLKFSDRATFSYNNYDFFTKEEFFLIQKRLEEIVSLVDSDMSEFDKVKTVYGNLLKEDFLYDDNNYLNEGNGYKVNNTLYGPLVKNAGVCSGIASALEVAFNYCDIDAVSCGGWLGNVPKAGNMHQWNQVKVDGNWYNLDLTNDYDKENWKFFMKSDEDYGWKENHCIDIHDLSENIHPCKFRRYDNYCRKLKNDKSQSNKQAENKFYCAPIIGESLVRK